MAMHPAGLRRNFKNIVHNYSEAQVKVREATSNDPWGPSSTLMCEIADLTYNVVAFSEIMQVIWKRLNDHGKNWRHVYKALVLLEYLIKTGTEKVAQQCKENIFAVQTLKDFQHTEENKDHGIHVREKAKQLVGLLKDDERLKNERARALKAKERFAQSSAGFGSDSRGPFDNSTSRSSSFGQSETTAGDSDFIADSERRISTDLESARPQTAGEEELQLQLALAMSQEEADQEEQRKQSDDVRLQMAITQSAEDFKTVDPRPFPLPQQQQHHQPALLDLLDVNMGASTPTSDPWGLSVQQSGGSALHAFCASTTEPSSSPWPPATQDSWHVVVKSTPKDVNVPLNDFKALCISASDNLTPLQNLENQSKWPDTPFPEPVTNSTLNVPDACSKLPEFKFWSEETVHKFDVTDLEQTPSPNPAQHVPWKDTPVPAKSSNLTSKSFPSSNLQLLKDLEHIEILQSKNGLTPKINYLLPDNNNCNHFSNSSHISKTPSSDLRAWGDAKFSETPLEKSFSKTSCLTPGGNKSNQTFSLVKHSNSVNNISQSSPTITESQEKSPYQKWLCEDIPIFSLFQSTSPTLPDPSVSPENKQTAKPAASSHHQQNDLATKDIVFDPLHSNAASPAIDAWGLPPKPSQPADPWGAPIQEPAVDPWAHHPSNQTTPVNPTNQNRPASVTAQPVSHSDPWGPAQDPWGSSNQYGSTPSLATNGELDEFDQITNRPTSSKSTNNLDFLAGGFFDGPNKPMTPQQPPKKTAESFLGENSALVNLDNLVSASATGQPAVGTTPVPTPTPANPFALTPNAFQAQPAPRLTMNQMRTQQQYGSLGAPYMGAPVQQPFMAGPSQQPFMGSPAQQPFMAAQPTPVAFNMTPVSNTTGLTNNPFL